MFVKLSKCTFAVESIEYLGHVISIKGVEPDKAKIQVMLQWPLPHNQKQLRSVLGLTGYYRKFVKGYTSIVSPLTDLLKQECFVWNNSATGAFNKLKHVMAHLPVLRLPNFTEPFYVETYASGTAIGAVLLQQGYPLAYFSRKLCPKLQKPFAYIRELYAITSAVGKWRQYLLGTKFCIVTDHKSLRSLMEQVVQTLEQQYHLTKLLGYHYEITYKLGKHKEVADALSRRSDDSPVDGTLMALSLPQFQIIDQIL